MFTLLNFCMNFTDNDMAVEAKKLARVRHDQLEILYFPKKSILIESHALGFQRGKTKFLRIGVTRGNMKVPEKSKSNIKTILSQDNIEQNNNMVIVQGNNYRKKLSKTDFLHLWIKKYFASDEYLSLCEEEFQQLIETVMKMDNRNDDYFNLEKSSNLKLIRFFNSMSQFLLMDYDEISVDLINIVLRIFIKFITGTILDDTNTPEEDSDLYKRFTMTFIPETNKGSNSDEAIEGILNFSLVERQNILIEIELFEIICKALSKESTTLDVQENLFILGIKLLEGGNVLGQKKLLEFIQQDKENLMFNFFKNKKEPSFKLIEKEMAIFNDGDLQSIIDEREIESAIRPNGKLSSKLIGMADHISNI